MEENKKIVSLSSKRKEFLITFLIAYISAMFIRGAFYGFIVTIGTELRGGEIEVITVPLY